MEIFEGDKRNFSTVIPKSVIDNLPMRIEEPEIKVEKNHVNENIKRRRGRPPKIKAQESIVYGSDRSTSVDGQWVRKDESDVGDGVKVKAEYKPEFQDCDADGDVHSENLMIIKNEAIDDSFDTESLPRFSSDTSDRSALNIKEEPLDIFHENVFQGSNDDGAQEFYVEEVNDNIVKKEMQDGNELERQIEENFIKCESAITSDNDENYSKNDKEKRHHCKFCEKSYKNKCHLSRHVNHECLMRVRKKPIPEYKCSDCHIHFKNKYTMQRHFASKHLKTGERTSCDACRKTFRDQKTLNRHLSRCPCNGAATNILTCRKCNKEYRHATSVWRHMTYECEKVPRFGCAHCDFMTLQKGNIVKHFRRKHAEEDEQKKYDCPKCKKIYKNEFTLKRHVNFECGKEPAFSCAFCKFKTKRKFSLDMHIKHKH